MGICRRGFLVGGEKRWMEGGCVMERVTGGMTHAYSISESGSPASIPASERSDLASAKVMRTALSPGGNWKVPASG